jgi:chemotaxis protein MotB
MIGESTDSKHEIVIIRRHGGQHEEGHHGGAWKIAYADFVTAMMAFFLVMWLINASNEATRAQVASYFNPVKLTDSSTNRRGLSDPKETLKQKQDHSDPAAAAAPEAKGEASEKTKAAEAKLLEDPMKTLDKIAAAGAAHAPAESPSQSAAAAVGAEPAPTAETPRDPFDPMAWQAPPQTKPATETVAETPPDKPVDKPPEKLTEKPVDKPAVEPVKKPSEKPTDKPAGEPVEKPGEKPAEKPSEKPSEKPEEKPATPAAETRPPEALVKLAATIREEILAKLGADAQALPANLNVTPTGEGVLISLTDKSAFGMFTVGSAEPDARLIALVAAIAATLKDRKGFVVVRGHTDSRPYRNKTYDNWQLSTARAHMAYYMLLRGGLDEKRVNRVEGYADRDPINPANPEADENRRIDILLGGGAP